LDNKEVNMALRLAGEEASVLQGLDGLGWLREVRAGDMKPALKVNQQGTGRVLDFQDGGVSVLYMDDGGNLKLSRILDFTSNQALQWPSAGDDANNTLLQWTSPSEDTVKFSFDTRTGIKKLVLRNITDAFTVLEIGWDSGGDFTLYQELDARQAIRNAGASNGGAVAVDDELRLIDGNALTLYASGTERLRGRPTQNCWVMKERADHMADADVSEDFGHLYLYNDGGGTRQLVVKYKDGGTVYTGTLSLS